MRKVRIWLAAILALLFVLLCSGCNQKMQVSGTKVLDTAGEYWNVGFGSALIQLPENSDQKLYIAGYHGGWEITGVLDICQARAVGLDTGREGVLLIGIDCIGLDRGTVTQIRQALKDIPNCAAVHVYATHTHAGPDTLGLWGPTGIDGKNDAYMQALVQAAEQAARAAAANTHRGTLRYGQAQTELLLEDSRKPEVMDETLYQIRFEAEDGTAGLRLLFYGAHAESLRGNNTKLSRDFPGYVCDGVTRTTGDNAIFLPGAIGGLIMTRELTEQDPEQNLKLTAAKLVEAVLSIQMEAETVIPPQMAMARCEFEVPLDNPVFVAYRFLGILQNDIVKTTSATGYGVQSELSVLKLGDVALALIPGEIFPELVTGEGLTAEDPLALRQIAAECGIGELLIVGLANDELGYIVPPSDFLIHEQMPYLERIRDEKGEDHYEETNSVGPLCAQRVAEAFTAAVDALNQ